MYKQIKKLSWTGYTVLSVGKNAWWHHFDSDPDAACHFDPDPDPTFNFDPDPDTSFQIKAQKKPWKSA